jgi:Protein of unknown function (DUF3631)
MRLLGSLFGNGRKVRKRTEESRFPSSTRDTPGGTPNTVPTLALATPALWVAEDGGSVLDDIAAASRRPVVMTDDDAATGALFALHAHCLDAARTSPLLAISAPTHGCGKTTLLRVMAALVPSPLFVSDITPAALYRTVNTENHTLLIDEAHSLLLGNGRLQRLLNAGHCRDGAAVARADGFFDLWCAKIVALIGELPASLGDRALRIHLKRKRAGEDVTPLAAVAVNLQELAERAARWSAQHIDQIAAADPIMPESVINRTADNWRALVAIADVAGGRWPELARRLANAAANAEEDDRSVIALLRNVRTVFLEMREDRVATVDLIAELNRDPDWPWSRYHNGRPLTAYQMASLLRPFRIQPKTIRFGDQTYKGYYLADFDEAFERYLK